MEMLALVKGGSESRWIRAFVRTPSSPASRRLLVDAFEIRINCRHGAPAPPSADPAAAPSAEAMANTTPLVLDSVFFPFGKEPRQFDTFYLGSKEAFSKKGADVVLDFEMADTTFTALSRGARRSLRGRVLAGVAQDGALYLLQVDATHRCDRQVPRTGAAAAAACRRRRQSAGVPAQPSAARARCPSGTTRRIPTVSWSRQRGDAVWVWRENSDRARMTVDGSRSAPCRSTAASRRRRSTTSSISPTRRTLLALRGGQLSRAQVAGRGAVDSRRARRMARTPSCSTRSRQCSM